MSTVDSQSEIDYLLNLWKTSPRQATVLLRRDNHALYTKIDNAKTDGTFSEKAWVWVYGEPLSCLCCGSPTKFLDFSRGYRQYCSKRCVASSDVVAQKKVTTLVEKYGVSHYSKTQEYREKFVATCQSKYGVSNPGQIEHLKDARARQKQKTFFDTLVTTALPWSVPHFTFNEYSHVRDSSLKWECVKCSNIFSSHVMNKVPQCPTCYPSKNTGGPSSIEKEILSEIKSFYSGSIVTNSRELIPPKELDLYFPDCNFAIEVNGIYWHSDQRLPKDYHAAKFKLCEGKGIALLMITDYEWATRKTVIIKMIKHRLQVSPMPKVRPSKCSVIPVSVADAKQFFDSNHIAGWSRAAGCLGLEDRDGQLVAAMLYSTNRFSKDKSIEIVRFAVGNAPVPGALGKLLNALLRIYPGCVVGTYADLRYGTGNVYFQNGFTLKRTTPPGYWYYINNTLYHRLSWTKQKLVKLGHNPNKTEQRIMLELGAIRIYDCGHRYFIRGT